MTLPELAAPHPPTLMSTSVPSERPKLIDDARKAPEGHKVRARPRVEFGKALLNATVLVRAASLQVEAGVVVARSHSDPSMISHGPSSAAGRARRGHDKARAGESASGSGKMFRPTKLVTCNMLPVRFLRWGRACPDDEPGIGRPTTATAATRYNMLRPFSARWAPSVGRGPNVINPRMRAQEQKPGSSCDESVAASSRGRPDFPNLHEPARVRAKRSRVEEGKGRQALGAAAVVR